jgi:hypothetical protein
VHAFAEHNFNPVGSLAQNHDVHDLAGICNTDLDLLVVHALLLRDGSIGFSVHNELTPQSPRTAFNSSNREKDQASKGLTGHAAAISSRRAPSPLRAAVRPLQIVLSEILLGSR